MSVERSAEDYQGKILTIVHKMYQALQAQAPNRELAALDVELVDTLLASTGNVFMQVAGGSSRSIRQALTEKSYELIDVKAHLDWLVSMMMKIASGMLALDDMVEQYNEYIDKTTQPLKDYLAALPKEPRLISSPLLNGRDIMDLEGIMKKPVAPVATDNVVKLA